MSYNSLVKITTINTALSIATRPFDVCLMISKTKNIATADNLPIFITSANDLLAYSITTTDEEYAYARDFFGATPKPEKLMVYGKASGTYTEIIGYLDLKVPKSWFYTLILDGTSTGLADIKQAIMAVENYYVWLAQSPQGASTTDTVASIENIKHKYGYFIASNVAEKQIANLIGSRISFFPGSVPFSDILMSGMLGSTYDTTEKIALTGASRLSATGINICTVEDQIPVVYYGKATDGITWFDYPLAEIAIDEYMRVGMTTFLIKENTKGRKFPANDIGASRLVEKGKTILREFADRNIIYAEDSRDTDGNNLFDVRLVSLKDRTIEIEYSVFFQGAIIKATIQVSMDSLEGN